jgi:hypothetical protein
MARALLMPPTMRVVWILALLLVGCTSSSSSAQGDDDAAALSCTLSLEGTHCSPGQSYCAIEGQPSCTNLPTSGGCDCNADGTWHCYCACYGPQSTCEVACPPTSERAQGAKCDPAGYQCPYTDRTCTCTLLGDGTGSLQFVCT